MVVWMCIRCMRAAEDTLGHKVEEKTIGGIGPHTCVGCGLTSTVDMHLLCFEDGDYEQVLPQWVQHFGGRGISAPEGAYPCGARQGRGRTTENYGEVTCPGCRDHLPSLCAECGGIAPSGWDLCLTCSALERLGGRR